LATERIDVTSVVSSSNLTGATTTNLVGDGTAADTTFATATANTATTTARVALGQPTGSYTLSSGAVQSIRVRVRKNSASGTGSPTCTIAVYNGASLVATSGSTAITSTTGQTVTFSWDGSATDGTAIEVLVTGTASGGSPAVRASMDIGNIDWLADFSVGVAAVINDAAGTVSLTGSAGLETAITLAGAATVALAGSASLETAIPLDGAGTISLAGSSTLTKGWVEKVPTAAATINWGWNSNDVTMVQTSNDVYHNTFSDTATTALHDWSGFFASGDLPSSGYDIVKVELVLESHMQNPNTNGSTFPFNGRIGSGGTPFALGNATQVATDAVEYIDITSAKTWTRADLLSLFVTCQPTVSSPVTSTFIGWFIDRMTVRVLLQETATAAVIDDAAGTIALAGSGELTTAIPLDAAGTVALSGSASLSLDVVPTVLRRRTGSVTFGTSDLTKTVDLTADPIADTSKTILFATHQQSATGGNAANSEFITHQVTDVNTLTFARNLVIGGSSAPVVEWTLIEFADGVLVQRGAIDMDTASGSPPNQVATRATAVDVSRTFVLASYRNGGSTFGGDDFPVWTLENSTTLRAYINVASTSSSALEYQVVEYPGASVQRDVNFAITGTGVTKTLASSVNLAKSFVIAGFRNEASDTTLASMLFSVELSSTQVIFTRYASGGFTTYGAYEVVTFSGSEDVKRGQKTIASGTASDTASVSPAVTTSLSAYFSGGAFGKYGRANYTTDDMVSVAGGGVVLDSGGSTLTFTRGSTAAAAVHDWQVIQFAPSATAAVLDGAATIDLTASGDLSLAGSGVVELPALLPAGSGTIGLTGAGDLTTAITLPGSATIALAGSAALTTAIELPGAGTVALTGAGALTTAITLDGAGTIALDGSGSLQVLITGDLETAAGTITLAGSGDLTTGITLSGAGTLALTGSGALTNAITLAAAGTVSLVGAGSLTTTIVLAGASAVSLTASGSLTTAIELPAAGSLALSGSGDLSTAITLSGGGTIALLGEGDLIIPTGASILAGSGIVAFTGTADLLIPLPASQGLILDATLYASATLPAWLHETASLDAPLYASAILEARLYDEAILDAPLEQDVTLEVVA
jgi:hypothetical protein